MASRLASQEWRGSTLSNPIIARSWTSRMPRKSLKWVPFSKGRPPINRFRSISIYAIIRPNVKSTSFRRRRGRKKGGHVHYPVLFWKSVNWVCEYDHYGRPAAFPVANQDSIFPVAVSCSRLGAGNVSRSLCLGHALGGRAGRGRLGRGAQMYCTEKRGPLLLKKVVWFVNPTNHCQSVNSNDSGAEVGKEVATL